MVLSSCLLCEEMCLLTIYMVSKVIHIILIVCMICRSVICEFSIYRSYSLVLVINTAFG